MLENSIFAVLLYLLTLFQSFPQSENIENQYQTYYETILENCSDRNLLHELNDCRLNFNIYRNNILKNIDYYLQEQDESLELKQYKQSLKKISEDLYTLNLLLCSFLKNKVPVSQLLDHLCYMIRNYKSTSTFHRYDNDYYNDYYNDYGYDNDCLNDNSIQQSDTEEQDNTSAETENSPNLTLNKANNELLQDFLSKCKNPPPCERSLTNTKINNHVCSSDKIESNNNIVTTESNLTPQEPVISHDYNDTSYVENEDHMSNTFAPDSYYDNLPNPRTQTVIQIQDLKNTKTITRNTRKAVEKSFPPRNVSQGISVTCYTKVHSVSNEHVSAHTSSNKRDKSKDCLSLNTKTKKEAEHTNTANTNELSKNKVQPARTKTKTEDNNSTLGSTNHIRLDTNTKVSDTQHTNCKSETVSSRKPSQFNTDGASRRKMPGAKPKTSGNYEQDNKELTKVNAYESLVNLGPIRDNIFFLNGMRYFFSVTKSYNEPTIQEPSMHPLIQYRRVHLLKGTNNREYTQGDLEEILQRGGIQAPRVLMNAGLEFVSDDSGGQVVCTRCFFQCSFSQNSHLTNRDWRYQHCTNCHNHPDNSAYTLDHHESAPLPNPEKRDNSKG